MKTTEAIQDKLQLLYALQKEQEAQVSAGIAKLSSVLTPGHLISELIGSVVQKAPQSSPAEQPNYSPLWDKLTDQVGITSPVAKSTIHLVLDQLMNKWLQEQAAVKKEDQEEKTDKAEKTVKKIPQLDHSLNHF
jgi:hypothetical protein